MAILKRFPHSAALVFALFLGTGTTSCSVLLDPDDLALDDTGRVDSTPNDTGPGDTGPETTDGTDAADGADASPDATTDLVVRYSGQSSCILEYTSVLSCPQSCDWPIVFDASESTGIGAFAWRLSATGSYRVSPQAATGARIEVTLQPPSCELFPGVTVGPAKVLAEVSLDGGPYVIGATLDFSPQQVAQCSQNDLCPAP